MKAADFNQRCKFKVPLACNLQFCIVFSLVSVTLEVLTCVLYLISIICSLNWKQEAETHWSNKKLLSVPQVLLDLTSSVLFKSPCTTEVDEVGPEILMCSLHAFTLSVGFQCCPKTCKRQLRRVVLSNFVKRRLLQYLVFGKMWTQKHWFHPLAPECPQATWKSYTVDTAPKSQTHINIWCYTFREGWCVRPGRPYLAPVGL